MQPPGPPATIGSQPRTADEVNVLIGQHLRTFLGARATISNDRDFLAGVDLKGSPYYFTPEQEALLKSAINDLDTALDVIDMTFVKQIVGMW